MREEFVSRQQVNLLRERIRKAEETDATKELYNYMWELFEKNNCKQINIMVVGAGGSYPSALFAKYAIQFAMSIPNVEAATPQTAVRILTQFDEDNGFGNPKYDLVIGISYSGMTPDIKYVSELCSQKGFPFILVTGAEKSTLVDNYCESDSMKIVSYYNAEDTTGKERGMISMFETLAPVFVFSESPMYKFISENQETLEKSERFVSDLNISEVAKRIKRYPIIHVFYEWDTLPTAIDIESKFTESGIANVVLHEKKNFSHGRYTSLYNQKFAVVINLTIYVEDISSDARDNIVYRNEYDENLAVFLRKICKEMAAQYIEIGKETETMLAIQNNLEAMSTLPYLITAIGEELGKDVSKPLKPFPEEAIQLYDYKGKF